ncbi:hypothetical protein RRG08_008227 [Elysia crispata]|uniref:Uncharacterized protein n=1 Tax=Elysia crispata TaxID=231223 RepID=A0AAE0YBQ4_9GAST|nr:hypothetical protein RRG08_008227 [Elysia crispata]
MPADEPLPLGMDSIDYYFKPSVMRRDGVVSFLLHSLGMFQTRLWEALDTSSMNNALQVHPHRAGDSGGSGVEDPTRAVDHDGMGMLTTTPPSDFIIFSDGALQCEEHRSVAECSVTNFTMSD